MTTTKTRERVAVYARAKEFEKVMAQLVQVGEYCRANGLEMDERLIYTDTKQGDMGIDNWRGFTSLIEDIETGKFKTIVLASLNSVPRSPVAGGCLIHALQKHGVTVITSDGGVYRPNEGFLRLHVHMSLASEYTRFLKRRKRGSRCANNCHE